MWTPYVVTFYYDSSGLPQRPLHRLPAQPDPGGVLLLVYSSYSYRNIATPQAAAAASDDGGGLPIVPIAVGVAVVGAVGVLLAVQRRRSTQDERE